MSYKEKYLKYKNKYIKLKNQIGGWLDFGSYVKTIQNDGRQEGMTLQCFWISILQYLNSHNHPGLTLRELRAYAGLTTNTEHEMFDTESAEFINAAETIAQNFGLQIYVYRVTQDGMIIERGRQFPHDNYREDNVNIVNIASFGLYHFELIDENEGKKFVPAVIYQNDLTKINDIDNEDIQPAYLNVVELTEKLKDLYKMQKENNKIINVLEESINDMMYKNTDKSKEYKRAFINAISDKIENIETELNSLKEEIQLHNAELKSLKVAIQLHEAELS